MAKIIVKSGEKEITLESSNDSFLLAPQGKLHESTKETIEYLLTL